jgi:general L-amino acid transport system permease protein
VAVLSLLTQRPWPSSYLVPAAALAVYAGYQAGRRLRPPARLLAAAWVAVIVLGVVLLAIDLGRGGVPTGLWGGLLLTMLLALSAIVFSFPLGVLLAVGRSSKLPVVSSLCIAFIEVVRGVPLVAVLFMAQLFVPLFLPGVSIDKVVRAVIGMTLFASAYLAENVRGGLQAVGVGQTEAARAVGLTGTQTMLLIVLPQALRAVIPAIVGQFIALFKDTSLVAIIGLTDLLGVANSIAANPAWLGLYKETYIAVAVIYFAFSYALSLGSRGLERRLAAGR